MRIAAACSPSFSPLASGWLAGGGIAQCALLPLGPKLGSVDIAGQTGCRFGGSGTSWVTRMSASARLEFASWDGAILALVRLEQVAWTVSTFMVHASLALPDFWFIVWVTALAYHSVVLPITDRPSPSAALAWTATW